MPILGWLPARTVEILRACVVIELDELCMHNMLIGSNVDHFTGG